MPVIHNKEALKKLLIENKIPLNDAVKRGEFYKQYFDWQKLCNEYKEGKSIRQISKETNLSYDVIRSNLKSILGELRDFSRNGESKYSLNNIFFPLTNEGSYLLGWLYSDGTITKNKISIVLQEKDKKHLEYLASLLSDKPVLDRKVGCEMSFYSVELCNRLMKEYHLLPDKSHNDFEIPFHLFSEEQLPYLLLGLFEGDGSISAKNPSCMFLLSKSTVTALQQLIPVFNICTEIKLNKYNLLRLDYTGLAYFHIMYYLYSRTPDVKPLERKFERFKNQVLRSKESVRSPFKKKAVKLWDSLNSNTQKSVL